MQMYKILLVDDEPDNLALLYRTLRGKYELYKTTSPLQALEMLKEKHIDLILSDHKMPEMDGVEFLKRVYDSYPNTMRLLVTAYTDASILIDAINYAKIYRYIKKPYSPDELLMTVANSLEYLQLKMDNEVLINDLKDLFSGTIKAIIEALDAKDSYTSGRSRRVTFYTMKIVESIGVINPDDANKIELAGLLHDIGMIGVSDDLLCKSEQLTQEEFDEIKKHVQHGVRILEDIKQLKGVVEIIKYHHEYFNGHGYPYGLKGEEIPLGSRVIAVADALDGMLSSRAYREPLAPDVAISRLKEMANVQFDPKVVEALERVLPKALEELKTFETSNS